MITTNSAVTQGKSLSLICGTMAWLRADQQRVLVAAEDAPETQDDSDDDEPAWMRDWAREQAQKTMQDRQSQEQERRSELQVGKKT